MTEPTLTLTATVPAHDQPPMVVECPWLAEKGMDNLPCEYCEYCPDEKKGTGTRRLRYEVVAPIYHLFGTTWAYSHSPISSGPIETDKGIHVAMKVISQALVEAHRAGETLPGVEITEVRDET